MCCPKCHFSSKFRPKLCISFFSSKMLNFAISFVFHPKRICVPNDKSACSVTDTPAKVGTLIG